LLTTTHHPVGGRRLPFFFGCGEAAVEKAIGQVEEEVAVQGLLNLP
jgi:hypothetical protein